ncbi:Pycsar system effector family protein [Saccharopolyspora sp. NPDC050642]|uniref:Pycsar system effector family protein n=1 Tax=Saccharopolyspora sp. NPDC050642 TaxID=3157099 RepID=UPI0033C041CE
MVTNYVAVPAPAEHIAAGRQDVQAQLQRADTKAQALLGLTVGVLAGVAGLTRTGVSPAALVLLCLAAIPTATAVGFLLWVIRPYLGGAHAGFVRWAHFVGETEALLADLDRPEEQTTGHAAHELAVLSRLAVTKYERIAWSVYLLLIGLGLALPALFLA